MMEGSCVPRVWFAGVADTRIIYLLHSYMLSIKNMSSQLDDDDDDLSLHVTCDSLRARCMTQRHFYRGQAPDLPSQ